MGFWNTTGIIGAGLGINAGKQAWSNWYNSNEAQKQRDWASQMSNTRYQRTRADLESAGYNPMLAVTGGQTAGQVPSGSTASNSQGSGVNNLANTALNAVSTNSAVKLQKKQGGVADSQIQLNDTQAGLNNASAVAELAKAGMYGSTSKQLENSIVKQNNEIALLQEQLKNLTFKNSKGKVESDYYNSKIGSILHQINMGLEPVQTAAGIYGNIKHGQAIQYANKLNTDKYGYAQQRDRIKDEKWWYEQQRKDYNQKPNRYNNKIRINYSPRPY